MGRASYTSPAEQIVWLEGRIENLEAQIDALQRRLSLQNSLYKLTIKERDFERRRVDELIAAKSDI